MKDKNLAIVVPAYKIEFFEQAILSISKQSCKRFNLYIGNDGSDVDFESVIQKYSNEIPIVYYKFNENIGRNNLVGHWERCIDLIGEEEWVWLFSDDDYMDPDCVENFYKTIDLFPSFDVYHFNVTQVNNLNQIIKTEPSFPQLLRVEEFISLRLHHQIMSLVVEYVFRKETLFSKGRFEKFDLAWGSDDATWIKIGHEKGIFTIEKSKVYWRRSDLNISCNISNDVLIKKYNSRIQFGKWLIQFSENNKLLLTPSELRKKIKQWYYKFLVYDARQFTIKQILKLIKQSAISFNEPVVITLKNSVSIFRQLLWLKSKSFIKVLVRYE